MDLKFTHDQPTHARRSLRARLKEWLGWASADRRAEAEGKLQQLDEAGVGDPSGGERGPEEVLDEAELEVRHRHADLAPGAGPDDPATRGIEGG